MGDLVIRAGLWFGIAWGLSGCVLKGPHELVRAQLEATRSAFSTRAVESEQQIRALEAEIAKREIRLDEQAVRVDQLRTLSELKDSELERVVSEQVALADEILRAQAEIDALKAEVKRLEGLTRRRRPRTPPPEPEGEARPTEEPPEPTDGQAALATLQARVQAQLDQELLTQLDSETHEALAAALVDLIDPGFLTLTRVEDGSVIRIETRRLFQEGWTTLSPRGQQIVEAIGTALASLPGRRISVEGHTDDAPIHTAQFPSNWERGFGRAIAVLRGLTEVAPRLRISATSFASSRPIVPHDTPDAETQNRRVEIVVRGDPTLLRQPLEEPDAEDEEAEPAPSESPTEEKP
ncbi:MAG: OmpA family protein [Myxococcota bacterium]